MCAKRFSISAERFFILLRLIFRFQEDKKTGNVEDENPFPEISFCVLLPPSVSSLESNLMKAEDIRPVGMAIIAMPTIQITPLSNRPNAVTG